MAVELPSSVNRRAAGEVSRKVFGMPISPVSSWRDLFDSVGNVEVTELNPQVQTFGRSDLTRELRNRRDLDKPYGYSDAACDKEGDMGAFACQIFLRGASDYRVHSFVVLSSLFFAARTTGPFLDSGRFEGWRGAWPTS